MKRLFVDEIFKVQMFLTKEHLIDINKCWISCNIFKSIDVIFHGIHMTINNWAFLISWLPRNIDDVFIELFPNAVEFVDNIFFICSKTLKSKSILIVGGIGTIPRMSDCSVIVIEEELIKTQIHMISDPLS